MSQSLSFDRVAGRYDTTRGYPPDVARQIAAGDGLGQLKPAAAALEIGIGTGRIALPLLECGVNVTGVDISPLMLEQLSAKYDVARKTSLGAAGGRSLPSSPTLPRSPSPTAP